MLPLITIAIIISTVIFSYKGFNDVAFFESNKFEVGAIVRYKKYKLLLTSGLLHSGWMHLIFNMYSLFTFGALLELSQGSLFLFFIYIISLLGGNLLSLIIYKNSESYSAIGASGAVCGVIFASLALNPYSSISLFFLPAIPMWIYGLLFTLYSIYGIRSRNDNIGHEAHLGGAVVGMMATIIMHPSSLAQHLIPILLVIIPALIFIIIIVKRPHLLLVDNLFYKNSRYRTIDDDYNHRKVETQKEVDRILDKIHKKGVDSLSMKERNILDDYAKK
jgi:membrane associated rhomboid family serine protease